MRHQLHHLLCGLVLAATLLALPAVSCAQSGEGNLLDLMQRGDVQAELKLSPQQLQQLEQLRESRNDRSGFAELMKKAREVTTDEERNQLRAQMQNYAADRRQQFDARLKEVLTEEQLTRANQVHFQLRGMRALLDAGVAEQLALTEEQQQQLAKLQEERVAAAAETGEPETDEARDQFKASWDARFAAALTAEQRQQWNAMTGAPLGSAAVAGGPAMTEQAPPEGADVVASFGSGQAVTGATPTPDDGKLRFQFQYAPWSEVLPLFADAADLTLDLVDVPPGTFTHIDNKGYDVTEALDILNGYLLQRGYVLVRREGGFLVSVRIDDEGGIPPNLVPTVSVAELANRGRNELLTVVFPVPGEEADVDAVATEVEKLVGRQGKVVGVKPTRSLVVTDIGSNLARINTLLGTVTTGPEDLVMKEYSLVNIYADDAEFLVRTLLGLSTDSKDAGASSAASEAAQQAQRQAQERSARFSRFGGGGTPFGRPAAAPTTTGTPTRTASKANTIADPRTNKLLVSATPSEHRIIEEALKAVDVSERSPMASDRPFGSMGDKQMSVIHLSNMDPTTAAIMLQSMYAKDGEEAPTVTADLLGRKLIVRGTEPQLYSIKQLLLEMGEDGTGQRSAANRGPVRTFSLSGRDPQELLPILERMWSAQQGSNLRVIVPGERDSGVDSGTRRRTQILRDAQNRQQELPPAPGQPPLDEPRDERPQRPEDDEPADDGDSRVQRRRHPFDDLRANTLTVGAEVEAVESTPTSDVQAPQPDMNVGGVTVRLMGDELILISQDEEALDELELMLEQVMQAIPPRTTWSIFPLKTADATEAAAMLEQLFPDSRVSQTASSSGGTLGAITGGIASFSSGVADLTGLSELGAGPQTLRIIPETRLNALWVSGPSYKVQEVEEMLSIIDSSGLTDSLRDRVPRLIPVKHADIDDVYEIVQSVYAPELKAPGGGGNNPQQAFAAMLGGRRGGDDKEGGVPETEPKVTLGVDRDTSNLIVSSDEGTFMEIEDLVASIDTAAQQARRTVMVRPLVNTNAAVIQNSLQSIIPKVTISTSNSRSRPGTSGGSSNDSTPSPGGGDDAAMQQRMEMFRRMREQQGGGGTPGSFGGDRGGRGGSSFGGDRGGRGGSTPGGGRGR